MTNAELFRYFTFPEPDRREIAKCRGESNKIGFALLLGAIRLTGRFLQDFELVPRSLLAHICEQLNLKTPLILTYPARQPTRYEHADNSTSRWLKRGGKVRLPVQMLVFMACQCGL